MAKNITYCIAGFYHFVKISNTTNLIEYLKRISIKFNLLGTILVATEGINGTISGKKEDITKFFNNLEEDKSFKGIEKKISFNKNPAFHRMKVRLKKEIVKMGRKNINPNNIVGEYISAKKWNDIIKKSDIFFPIAPETENKLIELIKLNKFKKKMVSNKVSAIKISSSKYETYKFLQKNSIPTLKTFNMENYNRTINWDGKSDDGGKIPTGVYLLTSYDKGYGSKTTKIAIINK